MAQLYAIDAIWIVIISLVTFAAYGIDKRRAVNSKHRIPEKRLHWLALVGGFPGAYAGQQYFRHKTQKTVFSIVIGLALILHVMLWFLIGYLAS